jgi:hypothetical protein
VGENVSFGGLQGLGIASRPRTVNEGVENELPVLLDQVVDVSEDAAHDGCEYVISCGLEGECGGRKAKLRAQQSRRSGLRSLDEERADERSGGVACGVGSESRSTVVVCRKSLQVAG